MNAETIATKICRDLDYTVGESYWDDIRISILPLQQRAEEAEAEVERLKKDAKDHCCDCEEMKHLAREIRLREAAEEEIDRLASVCVDCDKCPDCGSGLVVFGDQARCAAFCLGYQKRLKEEK